MASSSVGLYLGTESIDIIQVSGSFQHPRVLDFKRIPLPTKGGWRDQIRAEEVGVPLAEAENQAPKEELDLDKETITSLQAILKKSTPSPAVVCAAVAAESVVIRYFQMPMIPSHERKMAVPFEAKKYLPFKLEDLVTDFQVIVRRTDPVVMRVMFFGMKKSSSAAIMSLFKATNVSPLFLEASPISLLRLLRQTEQLLPGQVAAILSTEQDTATITIAGNDLLYLSRNVTITNSTETTGETPSSELLEALTNETRVSIDYYKRRFLGEPEVSKVLLYGKELDQKWMDDLKTALNLPLEHGDPFKRVLNGKDIPQSFAMALGLALRGLEKKPGQVNLMPLEQQREHQGLLKPLIAQVAVALTILGILFGVSMTDTASARQKLIDLKNLQGLPVSPNLSTMDLEGLERFQADQKRQLKFLETLSNSRGNHAILLNEMTRLLPPEAWFQYVVLQDIMKGRGQGSVSGDRNQVIRVAGAAFMNNRARELEGVNNYLSALKSNGFFKSAFSDFQLDSVQRTNFKEEEVTEFRLTCSSGVEGRDASKSPSGWEVRP